MRSTEHNEALTMQVSDYLEKENEASDNPVMVRTRESSHLLKHRL
jgi:hypothetical protein